MNLFEPGRKKNILETLNSIAWFSMDAAWMLELNAVAVVLIFPTFLTGLILCFMENKKSLTLITISILSWICMNVSWMLSELYTKEYFLLAAKVFLVMGNLCMGAGMYLSNNRSEAFFHFKRSRIKNFFS